MLVHIGASGGYPLYQDTGTNDCYLLEDDEYVYWGDCPRGASNQGFPPIIGPGVSVNPPYIQPGGSWYNDLLNTILGLGALGQGGTIQGGAINPNIPQAQPNYNFPQGSLSPSQLAQYQQLQQQQQNDSQFGSDLQRFVTKNFTWIAIGIGAFVLYKSGRK